MLLLPSASWLPHPSRPWTNSRNTFARRRCPNQAGSPRSWPPGRTEVGARQEAEKELEKLGELAGAALRDALRGEPPLALRQRVERLLAQAFGPVPAGEAIRDLRAIELLERIGGEGAREVLGAMAHGARTRVRPGMPKPPSPGWRRAAPEMR